MSKRRAKSTQAEVDLSYIAEGLQPLAVPICDLLLDEANAKIHADRDLAVIAASLRTYGVRTPAVVRRADRRVLKGNGSLQAARERCGWTHYPVVYVDDDENTACGYALADNRASELAEWDAARVQQLLAGIEWTDGDLAVMGSELENELNEIIAAGQRVADQITNPQPGDQKPAVSGPAPEQFDDPAPAPPADPITKRGDLWILGEHRLLCGDCRSPDDVARLMNDERAVMMCTDPPYGVDYAGVKNGIPGTGFKDIKDRGDSIENDDLTDGPALQEFLERSIRASLPHLIENPAFYFWHPMLTQGTFFAAAAAADILIHRQIVWVKPHMVLTRSGMYHWKHELCFYGWIRGKPCRWMGDRSQTSVWCVGESTKGRVHPTQKPVALFSQPIQNHADRGEVVYEPFAGSGSQIMAAEHLGRRCFSMEVSPKWCDAIVQRWEKLTGRSATQA